jgi:hypothetical protein
MEQCLVEPQAHVRAAAAHRSVGQRFEEKRTTRKKVLCFNWLEHKQ